MAVAFDATSAPTPVAGDVSWTHTPAGTPRGVLVFVNTTGGDDHVVSVTYGGVAMEELPGSPSLKTVIETSQVHAYFLGSGIPSGAQTVAVALASQSVGVVPRCYTVTADEDVEGVDVQVVVSESLANPSATLDLGGRTAWCALGLMTGQDAVGGITPLSGWTADQEMDLGAQTVGFYRYNTVDSTNVTAGLTQSADDINFIAVALSEVEPAVEPVTIPAGFTPIAVTSFDATVDEGVPADTIPAGFDAVAVSAFAATLVSSETLAAGFDSVSITSFPAVLSDPTVVRWGFLGNSNFDEYADDNRGAGTPYEDVILNIPEILAEPQSGQPRVPMHHRGLDLGSWDSRAEPRRDGFAHNWARSGAVAEDVVDDQLPGLVAQIIAGEVTHVAIQTPQNDWHAINTTVPADIYNSPDGGVTFDGGGSIAAFVTAYVDRMTTCIDEVIEAGAVGVVVMSVSDPMAYPPMHASYPNATRRGYVTAAIDSVRNQIAAHADDVNTTAGAHVVEVIAWDAGVNPEIFSTYDAGTDTVEMLGLTVGAGVAADSDPYYLLQHAAAPHQSTLLNGVTANAFIAAANTLPGISIEPFTDADIRRNAGIFLPEALAADFDAVAVTDFPAALAPGSVAIAAGFDSVPVSAFAADLSEGMGIAASFTAVPVEGFDATLGEGTGIVAGFDAVAVTGFDAAVVEGRVIAAGFATVTVQGFDAELREGGGFGAAFTTVPVSAWGATFTAGTPAGAIAASFSTVAVTGFDAELATGSRTLAADFAEVAVAAFDADFTAGTPGADTFAAEFTAVAVTAYPASLAASQVLVADFTTVGVTAWDALVNPSNARGYMTVGSIRLRPALTATIRRP